MDSKTIVMDSDKPAEQLLKQLVASFSAQKEVSEIYSFGSVNTGKSDQYSDVDITIVSRDPAVTSDNLNTILSQVGTPAACYVIYESDTSVAYTVMLRNQSPFQKVDIGIVSAASAFDLFENSKLQYKSDSSYNPKNVSPIKKYNHSKLDNQLMDCLLGSLRYLKHVHRGEVWSAYKFYRAFTEQYLKLMTGTKANEKLPLDGFKRLDKNASHAKDLIFASSQQDMSTTFLKYLNLYIQDMYDRKLITKNYYLYAKEVVGFWNGQI